MAYTCRLYLNSGFNSVNIPDGPSLLNSVNHIDVPALQILQSRDLQYVDVKVSGYESIKNADYCRVDDWFYFVDGIQMLNTDTARITLYADYLTSAGGVGSLHILDGVTSRVHVSDDSYGKYNEVDPYMAPAEPPLIETQMISAGENYTTVVKSTLNLQQMGTGRGKIGLTYTDASTGQMVTVPATIANQAGEETQYFLDIAPNERPVIGESKTRLFDVTKDSIKTALQEVNDLGCNGAVTAQVLYPQSFVLPTMVDPKNAKNGAIAKMNAIIGYTPLTSLPFVYYNGKNLKVNYSEHTPYGLITCTGDACEYMPSRIYMPGIDYPFLKTIPDPRTDGKPYFRFSALDGDVSEANFFRSAVTGAPWKQVPLVYEGEKGVALTQLAYNNQMQRNRFAMTQTSGRADDASAVAAAQIGMSAGKAIVGAVTSYGFNTGELPGYYKETAAGNVVKSNAANLSGDMLMQGISGVVTGGAVLAGIINEHQRAMDKYKFDKAIEEQAYLGQRAAAIPTISFSFAAELFNDLYRNPVVAYRYKYTPADAVRIDKILTMYGYKVTKSVSATDFTNRQKFNYIQAGITVGKLPRWWANAIALQISNGVRIWHVLPDNSHYTNNPVAT